METCTDTSEMNLHVTETPSTSSEAIIDSLFDSISKGQFNLGDELLSTVTTKITDSVGDQPSTSAADPKTEKIRPGDQVPSPQTEDCVRKTSRSKIGSIKIASLKESTKSQIVESAEQVQQPQSAKPGEEGEILPSDIESHESDSGEDGFNVIDETDGELAASDKEEKSSKKHKKKKKKKREKHRHRHERHKEIREDDADKKSRNKDSKGSENSSKRIEKPSRVSTAISTPLPQEIERRPWKKMLNFHLDLNKRQDTSYRSRRDYGSNSPSRKWNVADERRSGSYSKPYRRPTSPTILKSSMGRAAPNYDRRSDGRRSRSPESRRYSRDQDLFGPSSKSAEVRWQKLRTVESGHQERSSRKRSRSRSRQEPSKDERTSTGSPDRKLARKSPVKEKGDGESIDKQKLYEIARKNAAAMLKSGTLQNHLSTMTTEELMKLRSGGKSIEELIDHCRKIQKKEGTADAGDSSSDEDETKKDNNEDELDQLIRHPFLLKQQTTGFVFNVKNVIQLPIKTPAERAADDAKLRITFPVSSGEQHRNTDSEWKPVSPPPPGEKPMDKQKAFLSKSKSAGNLAIVGNKPMLALPPPPSPPVLPFVPPPPPPPPVQPPMEQEPVDVGEVVSTRLKAIQRLNDNANDVEALKMLHFAEEQLKRWAESKNIPGLFTGSTGADCLTPDQLAPPDFRYHAWARKDCLINAKPVSSGVGMNLMQKMGWRPGEGLGKNKEGSLEPLLLEVKSDRKGLLASEEGPNVRVRTAALNMKDFQGKHPVSVLMELCAKRKWGPPSFSCVEAGPSHDRRFTWKAMVNGVEYQAATPANNKKAGKAQVCQVVLQSLGLIPRDKTLPVVIG